MHMASKEVVSGKICRKHDKARTPYQRLLATGACHPEHKLKLDGLYDKTNPRQLRKDIYDAIGHLKDCDRNININKEEEKASAR